ncbi:uncharacterized protein LOC62_03G004693 [Vanrija pseudolonga]|uniref:Zn(2)-C6 fungal-type domain-containing protein n=1 Tax=Vanrija pseudolonga TaxID=143232 RepID=A0AAF1BI50_9TREE|nr:hypothetical protein LOC62_03G004693 [Vanrija pseudolonga]
MSTATTSEVSRLALHSALSGARKNDRPNFISCTHCRARKIRCSGERPGCVNCEKKGFKCAYDSFIKRRGPDKEPGGRLKPRSIVENPPLLHRLSSGRLPRAPRRFMAGQIPSMIRMDRKHQNNWVTSDRGASSGGYPLVSHGTAPWPPGSANTEARATIASVHRTWSAAVFESMNEQTVLKHCKAFLENRNLWFNFFYQGLFFEGFFSRQLGPPVVLAILSHTTFIQDGRTREGQLRALHYAEQASKAIDQYLVQGYRDPGLAQAALLLVAFEFQPHGHQNHARAAAAMGLMDTCAQACITFWDEGDLARVRPSKFHHPQGRQPSVEPEKITPLSIRQQEVLRMRWTLSQLAANACVWRQLTGQPPLDMISADPTKFDMLFPVKMKGEAAETILCSKSPWSLYHQAICLWFRGTNHSLSAESRRDVLGELDVVQKAAETLPHDPSVQAYIWKAKEWGFATRGHLGDLSSLEIRRWFRTQEAALTAAEPTATRSPNHGPDPSRSWWYLSIAYTAVKLAAQAPHLFDTDVTLLLGMVCESLDSLVSTWPCSALEYHFEALKRQLESRGGVPQIDREV